MEEYNKVLSRPEARHRYWHIHKDQRGFFPESDKVFKLRFDGKTFELKVNHRDDIMTGQLYAKHRFLEGDRIIVTMEKGGTFVLAAPDTQLYPNLDQ